MMEKKMKKKKKVRTDGHVFCEGDLSLFLDQLFRLKSIVEIKLYLFEALKHTLLIIDSLETELFFEVFFLI